MPTGTKRVRISHLSLLIGLMRLSRKVKGTILLKTINMPPASTTGHITLESLKELFNMPLQQAADHLRISQTTLKKICRSQNITRWPYRTLLSLKKKKTSRETTPTKRKRKKTEKLKQMIQLIEESGDSYIGIEARKKSTRRTYAYP